jgi:hypothetical protein
VIGMQLLFEARGIILKVVGGFLILVYLAATGIHMSNALPIHRALWGVTMDVRVALNCPTDTRQIWEVINRSREGDDVLRSDGRWGTNYSETCR